MAHAASRERTCIGNLLRELRSFPAAIVESISKAQKVLVVILSLPSIHRQAASQKIPAAQEPVRVAVYKPGSILAGKNGLEILLPPLQFELESFSKFPGNAYRLIGPAAKGTVKP